MAINIPVGLWAKYREAADFFIDELGSPCTLIYPPIREECENCVNNRMIGGGASSVYRKGNIGSFGGSACPYCNNDGFREIEQTGTITLRVYWTQKDWIKVAPTIQVPDAEAMIIGYLTDLPNLRRSTEIILCSDQSKYNTWRFILAAEPFPHGFKKDRYFGSFLRRSG